MSEERKSAEDLAGLVAEGRDTNWEEALRSAPTEKERRIIAYLRVVENVSRVLRRIEHSAPPASERRNEPVIGSWGPLELREKLGEGGFGEVFRAWDSRLEREVALKLLKSDPSRSASVESRVIEEGRLLAKLRHANVVTVHGAEVHDGRVGLWMEFIRGRSLEQLLQDQGPFGAREATLIGIDLCRALAAVHHAGVVHRDIKADNVMREEGGRIVLADFGAGIDVGVDGGLRTRSISGTPMYMASELLVGDPATERSDLFSLGVLLYRLVTGTYPIAATSWGDLLRKHERREMTLLRDQRQDLPEGFVAAVERALAWVPEERFATAGQMEQVLVLTLGTGSGLPQAASVAPSAARSRPAVRRRSAFLLVAAGVALVLALAVGSRWLHSQRAQLTLESPPGEREIATTPPSASYEVEAALYRVSAASKRRERLDSGAQLSLGDDLTLEFRASTPLHVYIVDEDDAGHSYALFPLPGLDKQNPLPAGATHVLPGTRGGMNLSWTVDTPGGREHLMILASPERLTEFEAKMGELARPGQTAVAIPDAAMISLRGIGSLRETPISRTGGTAGPLFEMAEMLASPAEVVSGVWLRRIDLENPHGE